MGELGVRELPSGTVTFLFTDIEGSTHRIAESGDETWGEVLAAHHTILREAFRAHDGVEVGTQGDAFFVAFERVSDAVSAAVEAQSALQGHHWPDGRHLRVRMGLHTGEAVFSMATTSGLRYIERVESAMLATGVRSCCHTPRQRSSRTSSRTGGACAIWGCTD